MTPKVELSVDEVRFTICVDWPEADVDAVLNEIGVPFGEAHRVNAVTPTGASVDAFLEAVGDDEVLERHGIDAYEFEGLMQGTCSVSCRVSDVENLLENPEVLLEKIRIAKMRMKVLLRRTVRYYREGKVISPKALQLWER